MTSKPHIVTQCAYTLQLTSISPEDQSWRNTIWKTHEAVNYGIKQFGEWPLTLRGGITPTLNHRDTGDSGDKERRYQRRLLALSWLTVESALGALKKYKYIGATGEDDLKERNYKVIEAFKQILQEQGLLKDEIET